MKISTANKNGVTLRIVEKIALLVDRIPWPLKRQGMAEVTMALLDRPLHNANLSNFGVGKLI